MLSKSAASMIIGISMGQEICLILGQVSHKLPYWKKKHLTDISGPGWRLTRKQLTSRPDHLWPELWKSMGKHAKLKEKQKWSDEKLHLENARKLRGIYFIDPEDTEFKETIKNARKKLETSVAPAMPCKIMKNCGSGASNKIKTKLACILEADESTRMRMGNSIPHNHEDHIAGKDENSLQHYNLVHKFIPMPQAMKIPAAKAAVDKEWEKLEKIPAWNLTKVRKNQRRSMKQRAQKFILPLWWTSVTWRMPNWRQGTALDIKKENVLYCHGISKAHSQRCTISSNIVGASVAQRQRRERKTNDNDSNNCGQREVAVEIAVFSARNLTKVRSKKQVIDEARISGATVHVASSMDICHLKNAEFEAKHRQY